MPRYDYLLFDADHTLFDFDAAELRALRTTLHAHGYPEGPEVERFYRSLNHLLWHRCDLGEIRREELVVERFAVLARVLGKKDDPSALNRFYLDRLAEGSELFPGAEELCRALAPHCTLAIVTNGVASAQRGRFSHSALASIIPWLFISEEVGSQKPEAEFFRRVLSAMDITDPSRAVVIGDNLYSDIQGGINAGLDTIWYHPQGGENTSGIRPTHTVASYEELLHYLLSP